MGGDTNDGSVIIVVAVFVGGQIMIEGSVLVMVGLVVVTIITVSPVGVTVGVTVVVIVVVVGVKIFVGFEMIIGFVGSSRSGLSVRTGTFVCGFGSKENVMSTPLFHMSGPVVWSEFFE